MYAVASAIDGITGRMMVDHGTGLRLLTGGDAKSCCPTCKASTGGNRI